MIKKMICRADEVPAGEMKEVEVEPGMKVLVANSGERYYACQAVCPHQDVPLCEGLFDGSVLTCHMHLWQWDMATGAPQGLAEAPLQTFDVTVEDGTVYLAPPNVLAASELFAGLPAGTLSRLSELGRSETYDEGVSLYRIGDAADNLFILESGRVEFLLGRDERVSPAGFVLRKGEVFGWAALLDSQPKRIARATCLEKSSLIRMHGREVLKVLESDPGSGYVVMRRLAELVARYLSASGAK
jgi:toluene monooxygenase system ferredoxin subunit